MFKIWYKTLGLQDQVKDIECETFNLHTNPNDLSCCGLTFLGEEMEVERPDPKSENGGMIKVMERVVIGRVFGVREYQLEHFEAEEGAN